MGLGKDNERKRVMGRLKMPTEEEIIAFCEAINPGYGALTMSMCSVKELIIQATEELNRLRKEQP